MSMRRQRIKATANLSLVKRKPRKEDSETSTAKAERAAPLTECDELISLPEQLEQPIAPTFNDALEDAEVAFKMPATSAAQLDDVFQSDIEDNVIQMDLQKTTNGYPMSPTKAQARQRLRPTPVFGQRRNSFVGSPLSGENDAQTIVDCQSPGTPTRRERYLSGSSSIGAALLQQASAMPQSPYKYSSAVMSPGVGRVRTESTCSVYSESGSPASGKQRKGESNDKSHQAQQRVNARTDFETRFYKGVPDKSTFKMFDMIYYNPDTNPMEQKPVITTIKAESSGTPVDSKPTQDQLIVAKAELAAAMPVPQLKLDVNGEMIIDEKTLEIETTAEVEARKVLANSSLILMDETTGNNGFYKRHKRTRGWDCEETVRFYRSLQTIGTDFSLMCQMFPQRTRRDLKLKFKREERINAQLINKALLYPKAFNVQELKDQLELEDRERAETERKWKEIVTAKAEMTQKRCKNQRSRAARALSDGETVLKNEHVLNKKLGKRAWAKQQREQNLTDENIATAKKPRSRRSKKSAAARQDSCGTTLLSVAAIKEEAVIKTELAASQAVAAVGPQVLQQELNALLTEEDEGVIGAAQEEPELILPSKLDKIVIDLDDGTINYISDVETEAAEASVVEEEELSLCAPATPAVSEHDIEQIIMELGQGSLVLVSSIDAENGDRVVNEIYMYNKESDELFEEPLNIPEHIVQCILNVMS